MPKLRGRFLNPDDDTSSQYEGVGWFCDECGAFLNTQSGFSDWYDTWTCTECGHTNVISQDNIYSTEQEYRESKSNSEDEDFFVNLINFALWYDYGIEYGSRWEKEIADHIEGCQAVLLFVTKGIFQKEKSYVKIEYDMATRYFDKAVYTVIMENIQKGDIPNSFLGW